MPEASFRFEQTIIAERKLFVARLHKKPRRARAAGLQSVFLFTKQLVIETYSKWHTA